MTELDPELLEDSAFVTQYCRRPGPHHLDNTALYKKDSCYNQPIALKNRIQVRYVEGKAVYRIYCHPFNITIDNVKLPCPDSVIQLPSGTKFTVASIEPTPPNSDDSQQKREADTFLTRQVKGVLKITDIRMKVLQAREISKKIESAANGLVDTFKGIPDSLASAKEKTAYVLSSGLNSTQEYFLGHIKQTLNSIWYWIEIGGIIFLVAVICFLLILSAPILEFIWIGIRVIKLPVKLGLAACSRISNKVNKSAAKNTTKYWIKAQSKLRSIKDQKRSDFSKIV